MIYVLAGALALGVALFLVKNFIEADPVILAEVLRYTGAALVSGLAVVFIARDRIGLGLLVGAIAAGLFVRAYRRSRFFHNA